MCRTLPGAILFILATVGLARADCTAGTPIGNTVESTPTTAFIDNGDGTITHTLTGLMWKKCAQGLLGDSCGIGAAAAIPWSAALAEAVVDNTASHSDWRLPNIKELDSLVETCGYLPAINQGKFPQTPVESWFWTSTTSVVNPEYAWSVEFAEGLTNVRRKDGIYGNGQVRLVRGGQPPANFDYLPEWTIPTRLEIPVDTTIAPTLGQKAVVMTHGYKSDVDAWALDMAKGLCTYGKIGVPTSATKFSALSNNLTKVCQVKDSQNANWDVWVLDWRARALTTFPAEAYATARGVGEYLATTMKADFYEHVHLIAHSAGSNLINSATYDLVAAGATVHATFLDAYDPSALPTGDRHVSTYGAAANWVDNYVDTRPVFLNIFDNGLNIDTTDSHLRYGFNVNVTPKINLLNDPCGTLFGINAATSCRHGRPIRFYGHSIVSDFPDIAIDPIVSSGSMGFPRSAEGGGDLSLLTGLTNQECQMQDDGSCVVVTSPTVENVSYSKVNSGSAIDAATGVIDYVIGQGATLLSSLNLGSGTVSIGGNVRPQFQTKSLTPTESPSWIALLASTNQPINTMRFNWRWAAGGEGMLRVFVDGTLVHEIDQRHSHIGSSVIEEIYIGGEAGTLNPGEHRIVFRLDGFGLAASGMKIADIELGLKAVNVPNLDIDASITATKYDALTDGLIIIRYLFGLTGPALTNGALGGTATRTDPIVIENYLDGIRPSLDIDGNGTADALTDGLLIIRYLFGLRGNSLIAGAFDPLGSRNNAADIETYIQSLMPQ